MEKREDKDFPTPMVFKKRFGSKKSLVLKILEYARERSDLEDISRICKTVLEDSVDEKTDDLQTPLEEFGFVYLMKSGRHYTLAKPIQLVVGNTNTAAVSHKNLMSFMKSGPTTRKG
jgi:hypothetical protein